VPLRDRGNAWKEDRRLVRAAGVVALFPDVDLAEFAGDVLHRPLGRAERDDVGEVAEKGRCRVFITDRGDVRFDGLCGNDADNAECARGVEELRVARATDLLVLIAQEEERPTLARPGGELRARVDGLEEAFLDEEVDDARGGFKALARNVDDEDAAVENVGEVRLNAGVGAKRVFELGIGEPRKRGLDRAVDAATFFFGVLRSDGRFVIDRALESSRVETRVTVAVGGAHLELEERVARGRDRGLADALVKNVVVEPFERVCTRDVEEDGQCRLRARDRKGEPEGRVTLALAEQFKGGFEEPRGGVRGEAVEQVKPELPDADALDRLARELRCVCGGRVEVAAHVEDESAAVEV